MTLKWYRREGEIAPKQSRKKISSKLGSAGLHRIEGCYTTFWQNFHNNYLIECCQTEWRLLCIIYMSVGKEHMTFESYGVLASIMLFMWTNNGNLFRIFTLHENNFREFKPKHVKFDSQTRNCFLGLIRKVYLILLFKWNEIIFWFLP